MSRVDIGFAEDCEPWQLESCLFPSKIGGKPAWLDPQNLPTPEQLECTSCKKPMVFLCQVYAPYEEDPNNFHRTLFVFVCRRGECCVVNVSNNMIVLRSNLRRDNLFYSYDPSSMNHEQAVQVVNVQNYSSLCEVCGCFAPKRCSKCKRTVYCSREHQVIDWKENHKSNCGGDNNYASSKLLFDEFEMVVEPEESLDHDVDADEAIEAFKNLELEGNTGTLKDLSESDLEDLDASASFAEDSAFATFRERISDNRDQVLRYERGGQPLRIADEPLPTNIPPCESCGSERQYEFQVMPQMLTVLKETVIDWGILIVYSCKDSCSSATGYKKEFIYKQDISES